MFKPVFAAVMCLGLSACGVVYFSPSVNPVRDGDTKVRVQNITPESTLAANQSAYFPKQLPAAFFTTTGANASPRGAGSVPRPISGPGGTATAALDLRVPPPVANGPYQIGIGDVLLLATPQVGSTVEQLTGLLAASNARQGYTVQDDGSIAIPNVGRVPVAGLTLEEAEAALFQRLVQNQIDPTFSLEVAEFNSQAISIGGAVGRPTVVPVGLRPVTLDEALAAAGGVSAGDVESASVRIYRDGALYQIPLDQLYSNQGLQRTQLTDGDSVFVDTEFQLDQAQAYFEQELRAAQFTQQSRVTALNELRTTFDIQRSSLEEERDNFLARVRLDSAERDYVYLTGEVAEQGRFPLPFGSTASLADAIYSADSGNDKSSGILTRTGNVSQIYVLRGSPDPREFGAITAWRLDGRDATNFALATRFELRPNDVIFVAEQPVTRWGRTIAQITPTLLTTAATLGVAAAR